MTYFCVQSVDGRPEWGTTKTWLESSDIGTCYERLLQKEGELPRNFFIRVLETMYESGEELCVRFEDDISGVNKHIAHNIESWGAIHEERFGLGWLISPGGFHTGQWKDRWVAGQLHISLGVVLWRKDIPRLIEGVHDYWTRYPDNGLTQDIAISDASSKVLKKQIAVHYPSLLRHNIEGKSLLKNSHDLEHDSDFGSFREHWKRK